MDRSYSGDYGPRVNIGPAFGHMILYRLTLENFLSETILHKLNNNRKILKKSS